MSTKNVLRHIEAQVAGASDVARCDIARRRDQSTAGGDGGGPTAGKGRFGEVDCGWVRRSAREWIQQRQLWSALDGLFVKMPGGGVS